MQDKKEKIIQLTQELIQTLGYDLNKEDFQGTPERVANMWISFLNDDASCTFSHFPVRAVGGIILIENYHFWSFCPHHLLPVKYVAKIGYITDQRAFGLSKLGRAAMCVAKQMPLQEDVAYLLAKQLEAVIEMKGIAVIVHGEHLCMQMRGIKDPYVRAASDYWSGEMLEPKYMNRFLNI